MALYIVKPWYKKQAAPAPIYGAEWAGGSDPSWTRTDAAANFADPNPYYSGMSGTPSSPFDNIMPWSGMRRVTDSNAGELVEIPKFYYKWTRDGAKMKLQISMEQYTGFLCSPAHAERGDGIGERDYVYIARYQCASDYISKTGAAPKVGATRATFRSGIHTLGANIWQHDFAIWWTVNMLYLVEFANWNSQLKIGYGRGNGSGVQNSGASDTMPYHTGTMQNSRAAYGVGVQYRHIENLWANTREWCDGLYVSGSTVYVISNPANFSDSSGGSSAGTRSTSGGYITAYNTPSTGYDYALFPSAADSSLDGTTYICDYYFYNSSGRVLYVGGDYGTGQEMGMLSLGANFESGEYYDFIGSRLMVLPPSRLT